MSSSPPASSTRSRIPVSPKPPLFAFSGSKPRPSSATLTSTQPVALAHVDPDAASRRRAAPRWSAPPAPAGTLCSRARGCGAPARRRARRRGRRAPRRGSPRARHVRSARLSIAAAVPYSSSAAGRSSTISARRLAISSVTLSTAASTAVRRSSLGAAHRRRQADAQAGERLQRLVVQLARPAAALLLGRLDALAQPLLLDLRPVATAVAALAANALSSRSCSRSNSPSSPSRS